MLEPPGCLSKRRGMAEWPFQKYVRGGRIKGVGWAVALSPSGHCICDTASPWRDQETFYVVANRLCGIRSWWPSRTRHRSGHAPPPALWVFPAAARKAKPFALCRFSNPHGAESEESCPDRILKSRVYIDPRIYPVPLPLLSHLP